jgi:hypothetical protein
MIIDLILNRKDDDGAGYNAKQFYGEVMGYGEIWPEMAHPIANALDCGENDDVQRELCRYIDEQGYNPDIKNYINAQDWLKDDDIQIVKVYGKMPEFTNF